MESGFFDDLRQFEFFGGEEKPVHFSTSPQAPVVNSTPFMQGIYHNEESIDLTSLLEACNTSVTPNTSVSSSNSLLSQQQVLSPPYSHPSVSPTPVNLDSVFSFTGYCQQPTPPPVSRAMYGSTSNENCLSVNGHTDMSNNLTQSVESLSTHVPTSMPGGLVPMGGVDPLTGTRPAPGKAPRKSTSKKRPVVKDTEEWRHKRDKNNVAVRKSREKSKRRIHDTESRVRELEEENRQLQSKITLLSKELNVLKSLFTSAGVAQPPLGVKEELVSRL